MSNKADRSYRIACGGMKSKTSACRRSAKLGFMTDRQGRYHTAV